jgi:hypothetical protein
VFGEAQTEHSDEKASCFMSSHLAPSSVITVIIGFWSLSAPWQSLRRNKRQSDTVYRDEQVKAVSSLRYDESKLELEDISTLGSRV